MNTMAILIACGKEEEIAQGTDAAFLTLGSRPIIAHSLRVFEESEVIDSVVVVVSKERVESTIHVLKRFGCSKVRGVVVGGVNRISTLRTVFSKIQTDPSVVVVHEASRPFITDRLLLETVKGARRYGCSIAAHRIPDATKAAPKGMKVAETYERGSVWAAQSPQAFKASVIKDIVSLKNKGRKIVDDESEFANGTSETHMVEAGYANMKIRMRDDLAVAEALFHARLVGEDQNERTFRSVPIAV